MDDVNEAEEIEVVAPNRDDKRNMRLFLTAFAWMAYQATHRWDYPWSSSWVELSGDMSEAIEGMRDQCFKLLRLKELKDEAAAASWVRGAMDGMSWGLSLEKLLEQRDAIRPARLVAYDDAGGDAGYRVDGAWLSVSYNKRKTSCTVHGMWRSLDHAITRSPAGAEVQWIHDVKPGDVVSVIAYQQSPNGRYYVDLHDTVNRHNDKVYGARVTMHAVRGDAPFPIEALYGTGAMFALLSTEQCTDRHTVLDLLCRDVDVGRLDRAVLGALIALVHNYRKHMLYYDGFIARLVESDRDMMRTGSKKLDEEVNARMARYAAAKRCRYSRVFEALGPEAEMQAAEEGGA